MPLHLPRLRLACVCLRPCVSPSCPAAMNEMTWRKVQDWEQLHCQECKYPTLLKFQGKPHDLR